MSKAQRDRRLSLAQLNELVAMARAYQQTGKTLRVNLSNTRIQRTDESESALRKLGRIASVKISGSFSAKDAQRLVEEDPGECSTGSLYRAGSYEHRLGGGDDNMARTPVVRRRTRIADRAADSPPPSPPPQRVTQADTVPWEENGEVFGFDAADLEEWRAAQREERVVREVPETRRFNRRQPQRATDGREETDEDELHDSYDDDAMVPRASDDEDDARAELTDSDDIATCGISSRDGFRSLRDNTAESFRRADKLTDAQDYY